MDLVLIGAGGCGDVPPHLIEDKAIYVVRNKLQEQQH